VLAAVAVRNALDREPEPVALPEPEPSLPWAEPPQLGLAGSGASDGGGTAAEPEADSPAQALVRTRFDQAIVMLHARRYEFAVAALEQVLEHQPDMPEAHVNMGYARLGAGDVVGAAEHFGRAIDLRPAQANAYYGLAEALEANGDLPAAVGAMRTFIHLTDSQDPFLPRARAALWEWRQRMETGAGPPADG